MLCLDGKDKEKKYINNIKKIMGSKRTKKSFLTEKFLKKINFLSNINFGTYFLKTKKIIKIKYNIGRSKPWDLKLDEIKKQRVRVTMYKVLF